jgi:hypothetical protein
LRWRQAQGNAGLGQDVGSISATAHLGVSHAEVLGQNIWTAEEVGQRLGGINQARLSGGGPHADGGVEVGRNAARIAGLEGGNELVNSQHTVLPVGNIPAGGKHSHM